LVGAGGGTSFGFVRTTEGRVVRGCAGLLELTSVAWEAGGSTAGGGGAAGVEVLPEPAVLLGGACAAATGAGSGVSPGFGLAGGLTGSGPEASAGADPSQSNPIVAATTSPAEGGNLSAVRPSCRRHRTGCVTSLPQVALPKW
jgi:hypothetical protein